MSGNNFNGAYNRPRILVAPLDWGLGHATRCVPIINELVRLDCDVLIAADKQVFSLLKKEFPGLVFLRCKGYEIRYSKRKIFFLSKIISQSPRLFFLIWHEKRWLNKAIKKYSIDAVVSDNRPGMYHKKIPSVYITHQLCIKTGNKITERLVQKIHYYFIKKYSVCWIPDFEKKGLAGELSHPENFPCPVKYIGPLTRFTFTGSVEKKYDVLIIISGPEPSRTIFENQLLSETKFFKGNVLFVRGLPAQNDTITSPNTTVTIVNHLDAKELNKVICESGMIISRSGYTTVMDLAALGKPAILIPTPGQTEQEYLAAYLYEKKFFYSTEEKFFSLEDTLEKAGKFEFKKIERSENEYKKAIEEFVLSLKTLNFASQ